MSELNGMLRDFPLQQVLKLIETGQKSGILVVTSETMRGSVFFRGGRVIFATTRSGPADGDATPTERRNPATADEKRLLSSVVLRLLRLEDGSFVFQSGVEPMHPTTGELSISDVLAAAEELRATWDAIESTLGSMRQVYTTRPVADPADVVLTPEEWNVVAALGAGGSAARVAMEAGMSEYAAATAMARLIDRKLLTAVEHVTEPGAADPAVLDQPPPAPGTEPSPAGPEGTRELSLAERYESYVNSRGSELREPPPSEAGVVLDLTDDQEPTLDVRDPAEEPESEPEPASELARRWRDLRRGKLPVEDE